MQSPCLQIGPEHGLKMPLLKKGEPEPEPKNLKKTQNNSKTKLPVVTADHEGMSLLSLRPLEDL